MRDGAIRRVGAMLKLGTGVRQRDWVHVPSLPDYQVNAAGQVRRATPGWGVHAGKVLSQFYNAPKGHLRVKTASGHRLVHRLVCEAFHGPPPPGKPHALHRDDDRSNNTPGNLYWGDDADNTADMKRNGIRKGPAPTITKYDVRRVLRALLTLSERKAAEATGLNRNAVRKISKGWRP